MLYLINKCQNAIANLKQSDKANWAVFKPKNRKLKIKNGNEVKWQTPNDVLRRAWALWPPRNLSMGQQTHIYWSRRRRATVADIFFMLNRPSMAARVCHADIQHRLHNVIGYPTPLVANVSDLRWKSIKLHTQRESWATIDSMGWRYRRINFMEGSITINVQSLKCSPLSSPHITSHLFHSHFLNLK